jgi:hypothetical protein
VIPLAQLIGIKSLQDTILTVLVEPSCRRVPDEQMGTSRTRFRALQTSPYTGSNSSLHSLERGR